MSVPSNVTDDVIRELEEIEGVTSITVQRGQSVKPLGDVISVKALDTDADAVLRVAGRAERHGPISLSTSTVDSLWDSQVPVSVRSDHDEASWEEAATAMRRHTRPNLNLILASAGGGVAAAAGLASRSSVTEATALVAAAIIAPVFEPWSWARPASPPVPSAGSASTSAWSSWPAWPCLRISTRLFTNAARPDTDGTP